MDALESADEEDVWEGLPMMRSAAPVVQPRTFVALTLLMSVAVVAVAILIHAMAEEGPEKDLADDKLGALPKLFGCAAQLLTSCAVPAPACAVHRTCHSTWFRFGSHIDVFFEGTRHDRALSRSPSRSCTLCACLYAYKTRLALPSRIVVV